MHQQRTWRKQESKEAVRPAPAARGGVRRTEPAAAGGGAPTATATGPVARREVRAPVMTPVGRPEAREAPRIISRIKAKRDDVIFFTTQLAVMVETGVTLSEALDAIGEQAHQPDMKALVEDLSGQVKSGVPFSAALERHPRSFSRLIVALMRASEASGTMGQMLRRAADYMAQERETVKRVKGAMIYPLCMLAFCLLVVTALLIFILPRFEKIYAGKSAILPAPTRFLLDLSRGIIGYWPLVLAGLAAVAVSLFFFFRSERGSAFLHAVRIHTPIIGQMYRKAYLARSLRTLATMIATGVSILEALEIAAQVAGNRYYAGVWSSVAEQAKEGSSVSEELARHDLVPRTVVHMVAAGERSGQLAQVMHRIADFSEEDVRVAVKAVTSLIEPAMIIIMGAVIGGIAMALLLPVFSLSRIVAR